LGYASTFDTLALVIVAVGIAVVLLLRDPRSGSGAPPRTEPRSGIGSARLKLL
jgi:hypothetical protein